MVYEFVQISAITIVFVVGVVVGGLYLRGGTPKNVLIHLSEMGSHTVLQSFQYKTEDQCPRVRTLRPPSTRNIPTITEKDFLSAVITQ